MSKNKPAALGVEILPYNSAPKPRVESSSEFSVAASENQQAGEFVSQNANRNEAQNANSNEAQNAITRIGAKFLRLVWLAIILGLAIEAALIFIALWFGKAPGMKLLVADLAQKISWSIMVCLALGCGTAISKLRMPIAGLTGLFAAPLAFLLTRSLHKGAAETLSIVASAKEYYSPLLMGLVKGFEYACLGLLIVWLGRQAWGKALAHLGAGLWIGVVFGSVILILTFGAAPKPVALADFVSRSVNEIFFPTGCSLIVFTTNTMGKMATGKT